MRQRNPYGTWACLVLLLSAGFALSLGAANAATLALGEINPLAGLCDTLRALCGQGIGILIAGQHVRRILRLAGRAYLLEQGRITDHAPGSQLLHSPHLRRALLNTA